MSIVENALHKLRQKAGFQTAKGVLAPAQRGDAVGAPRKPDKVPPPATDRLVQVDTRVLRAAGLLAPEGEERAIAGQFRQIKRPLIAGATGRGAAQLSLGHLVMVGSATPGEGKTFVCLNLAISMAFERDTRVLLVDADVAKPHISRVLGLSSAPGLTDALRDSGLDVASLILPTNIPGLNVLPAGQPVEHVTELIASERMREIVQRISECDPARVVLFDSSPLLLTTESQALAQAVGQVLLVVRAAVTSQDAVLDAVERLQERPISVVLTQSVPLLHEGYRYYGSGSGRESSGGP